MTTYEKVYKREKLHGNIFFSFLYNFRVALITVFALFVATVAYAGFDFFFELFSDTIILAVLMIIIIFILLILTKPSESVEERFRRIHEELGTDPETLNSMLENMTCVNDTIFVSNEYYINFRTGKVTEMNYITMLKRNDRYSKNAICHELIISTAFERNFEYLKYDKKQKRDDLYAFLSIITGIREEPKNFDFMKGFLK